MLFFVLRETFIEREQGESSNDRNDRAIRVTAKWYADHFAKKTNGGSLKVVLLTDDRANKEKAEQHGLIVYRCKGHLFLSFFCCSILHQSVVVFLYVLCHSKLEDVFFFKVINTLSQLKV